MITRSLIFATFLAGMSTTANPHEFTAGLHVVGPDANLRLPEIVAGFLLAADERDGHEDETSDGHLGGVDVQILLLPRDNGIGISGLYDNPSETPDVVILFSAAGLPDLDIPPGTTVVEAGKLPRDQDWRQSDFAARYLVAYGEPPTRDAARGYNEARRLDIAIRPLDGLSPISEFEAAIASTQGGLEW